MTLKPMKSTHRAHAYRFVCCAIRVNKRRLFIKYTLALVGILYEYDCDVFVRVRAYKSIPVQIDENNK